MQSKKFSFYLCSKFLKELEKCEDAPEKLASCFLTSVSENRFLMTTGM